MQVKLIVIDSNAFHFRQDFQDLAQRTRVLAELAQKLMRLAEEHDLAVSYTASSSPLKSLISTLTESMPCAEA